LSVAEPPLPSIRVKFPSKKATQLAPILNGRKMLSLLPIGHGQGVDP